LGSHLDNIESIKKKNTYIQKSLIELGALIEKAKSLEKFKDKDVGFKPYFDNLEQIRSETSIFQQNSTSALKQVQDLIEESKKKLDVNYFSF
jgi:hypothetical protein